MSIEIKKWFKYKVSQDSENLNVIQASRIQPVGHPKQTEAVQNASESLTYIFPSDQSETCYGQVFFHMSYIHRVEWPNVHGSEVSVVGQSNDNLLSDSKIQGKEMRWLNLYLIGEVKSKESMIPCYTDDKDQFFGTGHNEEVSVARGLP